MAQGLQCWNSAGVLVVDLGDYNMRYMGTYSITATTASSYTVTVPGMKTTGWIAYYAPSTDVFNEWSVICNNGSMTIIYLPTGSPFAGTYSFNVYKWTV
ncbi:hypothetical protein HRZ08_004668 [Escherichia coli]|uniref:hypothetical protein n=1 Tax=Enterobacteriaceae TaxID=543 RepID=UPI00092D56C4|nr:MULTISPECIES: hypothetical protein [Enterobacteriaceae]EFJ1906879.1 hypothetical protein [Escherichia coli]EFL9711098.1 hypothetical protein [Escherichia coli]EFR0527502.1 hypothetical protein [Escherichia coli]EFU9216879.1 hypothetical protein [Escherichia coli]EGI4083883.1 hypothetical protein [Escherichia coli]